MAPPGASQLLMNSSSEDRGDEPWAMKWSVFKPRPREALGKSYLDEPKMQRLCLESDVRQFQNKPKFIQWVDSVVTTQVRGALCCMSDARASRVRG